MSRYTPPRITDPAGIEHRLLDLVYTTDTTITAPALAYFAPCSIADATAVLDRLAGEDRLRMNVDDDGNVSYEVPNRQRLLHPPAHHAPPVASSALVPTWSQIPAVSGRRANPAVASILSLVIPGAGQLYAGRVISAVLWFVFVGLGYSMLVLPGLILHLFCIVFAAGAAHRDNLTTTTRLQMQGGS